MDLLVLRDILSCLYTQDTPYGRENWENRMGKVKTRNGFLQLMQNIGFFSGKETETSWEN